MILSLIFLSLLVLVSHKYKYRSFVYIYSVWFIVILFDYAVFQNIFVPFSKKFDLFFLCFSFLFVFFYLLFDEVISRIGSISLPKLCFFDYKIYQILSLMLGAFSLLLCIKAFALMPILVIRSKIAAGELSFHVGFSFPFIASCVFYQNIKGLRKYYKLLVVFLFLLAVISSSKQFIILAFLFSIPWYKNGYRIRFSFLFFICMAAFLLVFLLHIVTDRVAGSGNLVQKTLYTINGYLLGGLAVFQLFLEGTLKQHITTGSWVKTGNWIGNVYSGFYSFYQNYDFCFMSIKILIVSLVYAFLNIRRKSVFAQFMRIYSIYPLLFFIFSDLFFPAIAQWLIFSFAGLGVSFIKDKK